MYIHIYILTCCPTTWSKDDPGEAFKSQRQASKAAPDLLPSHASAEK